MDSLNKEYIGKDASCAKLKLEKLGYNVSIQKKEPKKDVNILDEELVIQVTQIDKNNILLTTSMFKKYI